MNAEELKKKFASANIRRVKVGGFDIDGVLRGKYVALDKFWSAAEKGFGFCDVIFGWDIGDVLYDNASVTGWHTGYPDILARIDLSTFRVLKSEPDTAHFLVDFYTGDGKPHPACPRGLLRRIVAQAEAQGFRPKFGAEFEFWIFRETSQSLYAKGFRDLEAMSQGMCGYSWIREHQASPLVHDVLDTMESYGIAIEGLHTETGPGVWEVALCYDDIMAAADKTALFKTTLKQICSQHGLSVTFMAKWNASLPGSSGHIHQSLWDSKGEANLFSDPQDPNGLSRIARHYLGGQVALMPELTALHAPFVNSYKRYVPGVWAPLTASWGIENRTCAIRIIRGPGSSATRIEYRQTAADMNPYIAMATCLGAGLYGLKHAIEPSSPSTGDASTQSLGAACKPLPITLDEATSMLRESTAAKEILGEAFVDHYVRTREWEVRQYCKAVTDWELRRYFESV